MGVSTPSPDRTVGTAYVDGRAIPLKEAKIPITDWGYRHSDVTYDVVGVYYGAFFRLEDPMSQWTACAAGWRRACPSTRHSAAPTSSASRAPGSGSSAKRSRRVASTP
jgi:hypothetical protein